MLIELILAPFWLVIDLVISLLPTNAMVFLDELPILNVMSYGVGVIGTASFSILMGNFLFWYFAQLTWACVEWVYKKLPGVD